MRRGGNLPEIFHAYDIRGRWGVEIGPVVAQRLGASVLARSEEPVLVGRDTRTASRQMHEHFLRGLRAQDHPVIDLGILPTPAMGFATKTLGRRGFVLSPSHNPVGYVGLKGFSKKGVPISREWREVAQRFLKTRARPASRSSNGNHRLMSSRWDWEAGYIAHLTKDRQSGLRVVLDCRGGATAYVGPKALRALGAEVIELNSGFSPVFFGGSPEPTPENIHPLEEKVVESGADIGITLDGDGDRVLFVDETGRRLEAEMVGNFLHKGLSGRGQPLVATVDASYRCEHHAKVVRTRVGGRFVAQTMIQSGSQVGFEVSSHFYLSKLAPDSDGLLTACVMLSLLSRLGRRPSRLRRDFGDIFRSSTTIPFMNLASARAGYRRICSEWNGKSIICPDGAYLQLAGTRTHLRISNTQPILRLTLESSSWNRLAKSLPTFRRELARLGFNVGT